MTEFGSIVEAKKVLRAEIRARLAAMDPAARRVASRAACARLLALDEVRDAGAVLFYMAMPVEVDPSVVMSECLRDGVRVAVPVIDRDSGELEAIEIESLDERWFRRDKMGILEPIGGARIRATELDAIVVPGLAFDRRGGRLGRGAGYYDRLLVRVTPRCRTIGFAFDCQVVESVPVDTHDRPVAALVTDRETTECEA
ncbi:MAG: 5-formyltetrahydrofolate cyclo-ligase [Phycisphaerales bacterium]